MAYNRNKPPSSGTNPGPIEYGLIVALITIIAIFVLILGDELLGNDEAKPATTPRPLLTIPGLSGESSCWNNVNFAIGDEVRIEDDPAQVGLVSYLIFKREGNAKLMITPQGTSVRFFVDPTAYLRSDQQAKAIIEVLFESGFEGTIAAIDCTREGPTQVMTARLYIRMSMTDCKWHQAVSRTNRRVSDIMQQEYQLIGCGR
jgi:hypothetical protein